MIVRDINLPDDELMVLDGMKNFISRMVYYDFLPDNDEELIKALQRLLDLGCVDVLVAEHEQILVGGIGMIYAPCIWNSDLLQADELFFWVVEDAPTTTALRLIRSAYNQAREYGCKQLSFKALTSSPKSLDKVYRSMKLQPVETSYMGTC